MDVSGAPDFKRSVLDREPFPTCDIIIHLAFVPMAGRGWNEAELAIRMAERVLEEGRPVVFASSVWADRHPLTPYAAAKRCIESMVTEAGGAFVRVGWVGWTDESLAAADDWHRSVAWTNEMTRKAFADAVEQLSVKATA
jgi:hypothetical protein